MVGNLRQSHCRLSREFVENVLVSTHRTWNGEAQGLRLTLLPFCCGEPTEECNWSEGYQKSGRQSAASKEQLGRQEQPFRLPVSSNGFMGRAGLYRPSTTLMPSITALSLERDNLPVRSLTRLRSIVTTCDTFATDSLESPVARLLNKTFPSASAHRTLLVSGTQIVVDNELLFKASA